MESDEDRPDPDQVRLVKELHREMADRRIVINTKSEKRKKKKRRNLTVQVVNHGNSSSGSDSNNNRAIPRRSRSVSRTDTSRSFGRNIRGKEKLSNASSDSEISELGEDKQQAELFCNKNKMAEARVTTTESKLQDFNARLAQRRDKLEELHQKLKLRKERLLEREERLREFEKSVLEKENAIKQKSEVLREKDKKLNEQMAQLGIFEALVNTKGTEVENKEKSFGVRLGPNNNYEKCPKFPKPILSTNRNKDQSKRISWADSAISSQSPSSNSSDDDIAMCNLSVSQRLKRFENRQLL